MLKIGLNRGIEEDDIYDVINNMRSDHNTEEFAKCWELELKKTNPSIIRVIFKLQGNKIVVAGILSTIVEAIAK